MSLGNGSLCRGCFGEGMGYVWRSYKRCKKFVVKYTTNALAAPGCIGRKGQRNMFVVVVLRCRELHMLNFRFSCMIEIGVYSRGM